MFAAIYAIVTISFFDIKFYRIRNIEFSFDLRKFKLDNLSDFLDDCQTQSQLTRAGAFLFHPITMSL